MPECKGVVAIEVHIPPSTVSQYRFTKFEMGDRSLDAFERSRRTIAHYHIQYYCH